MSINLESDINEKRLDDKLSLNFVKLDDEPKKKIIKFIESENIKKILNIQLKDMTSFSMSELSLNCLLEFIGKDYLYLKEKDIDIFEDIDKILQENLNNNGHEFFSNPNISQQFKNYIESLTEKWYEFIDIFCNNKFVILGKIPKNQILLRSLCSRRNLNYGDKIIKSKIIIINNMTLIPSGLEKQIMGLNLYWKDFIYDYEIIEKQIELYRNDLIAKTWHPDRFREWCLSFDELNDLN